MIINQFFPCDLSEKAFNIYSNSDYSFYTNFKTGKIEVFICQEYVTSLDNATEVDVFLLTDIEE